jgi:transposase-like protein
VTPLTFPDILSAFSTDAQCRELLARLRWPDGVKCLRCGGPVATLYTRLYQCSPCSYQFAVTTRTIFGDTHFALEKWFLAVLLIVEARKGLSAKQLQRTLGCGYKTAWYLNHRIRAAMASAERSEFRFSDIFLDTLRHMVTAEPPGQAPNPQPAWSAPRKKKS